MEAYIFIEDIGFLYYMDIRIAVLVFLAYIFIDSLYAVYTYAVANNKPVLAATSGCIMYALLAFGVKSFTENYWYLIPLMTGSWLGTYFTLKIIKKYKCL